MFYPRTDEGVPTTANFRRRVGHEVEIEDNLEFQNWLWDNGLGTPRREGYDPTQPTVWHGLYSSPTNSAAHDKHCDCDDADRYPIHTVDDTSASGNENLVGGNRGVLYGSPAYMEAIEVIATAARETGSRGGPETGGHIHVSKAGMSQGEIWLALRNAKVLWDQVLELAGGQFSEVRTNMHIHREFRFDVDAFDPRRPEAAYIGRSVGGTGFGGNSVFIIGRDGKDTVEWRIWNALLSKWRLFMAAGVSAAFHEAAVAHRIAEPGQDLIEHLDPFLADDLKALIARQRAVVQGDTSWAA